MSPRRQQSTSSRETHEDRLIRAGLLSDPVADRIQQIMEATARFDPPEVPLPLPAPMPVPPPWVAFPPIPAPPWVPKDFKPYSPSPTLGFEIMPVPGQ